ncbi:transmembrane protein 52-like [Heptranchias perlo]|uniref:transmembrane protein 52-like n=1 Tax=Heptranchias perlo TaxID=212740 RepID=UPI00355AB417
MDKCTVVVRTAVFILCLFQASLTEAQNCGTGPGETNGCLSSWTSLWYVWLILLTIFLLLLCGVAASCVKCCRRTKPQVPTFPARPYEVTVIAIDNDNTIHSTVSPNSSLQYVSTSRNGIPFQDANSIILPPPPYSLYAIETPPPYEAALKMAKPIEIYDPNSRGDHPKRNEEPSSTEETSVETSSALS